MSNNRIHEALYPKDRHILDANNQYSWVPGNPRDLILPYIEESPKDTDRTSIEARRKKAQDVYDKYGQIIETCKRLEDEISARCKDVKIPLDPQEHAGTITALKRIFGVNDISEITFDMYKKVVHAIAELSASALPNINSKGK